MCAMPQSALAGMTSDPRTGVVAQTRNVYIVMEKEDFSDMKSGLIRKLNLNINKYYPDAGGILMGYQGIKIKRSTFEVNTTTLLHPIHPIHLRASFYMFKHTVGTELMCVVTHTEVGRVKCRAHGVFQVEVFNPPGCEDLVFVGQSVLVKVLAVEQMSWQEPKIVGSLVEMIGDNVTPFIDIVENLDTTDNETENVTDSGMFENATLSQGATGNSIRQVEEELGGREPKELMVFESSSSQVPWNTAKGDADVKQNCRKRKIEEISSPDGKVFSPVKNRNKKTSKSPISSSETSPARRPQTRKPKDDEINKIAPECNMSTSISGTGEPSLFVIQARTTVPPNTYKSPEATKPTKVPKTPKSRVLVPPGFKMVTGSKKKTKPILTAPDGVTVFRTYKGAWQWVEDHPNYPINSEPQLATESLESLGASVSTFPDAFDSHPEPPVETAPVLDGSVSFICVAPQSSVKQPKLKKKFVPTLIANRREEKKANQQSLLIDQPSFSESKPKSDTEYQSQSLLLPLATKTKQKLANDVYASSGKKTATLVPKSPGAKNKLPGKSALDNEEDDGEESSFEPVKQINTLASAKPVMIQTTSLSVDASRITSDSEDSSSEEYPMTHNKSAVEEAATNLDDSSSFSSGSDNDEDTTKKFVPSLVANRREEKKANQQRLLIEQPSFFESKPESKSDTEYQSQSLLLPLATKTKKKLTEDVHACPGKKTATLVPKSLGAQNKLPGKSALDNEEDNGPDSSFEPTKQINSLSLAKPVMKQSTSKNVDALRTASDDSFSEVDPMTHNKLVVEAAVKSAIPATSVDDSSSFSSGSDNDEDTVIAPMAVTGSSETVVKMADTSSSDSDSDSSEKSKPSVKKLDQVTVMDLIKSSCAAKGYSLSQKSNQVETKSSSSSESDSASDNQQPQIQPKKKNSPKSILRTSLNISEESFKVNSTVSEKSPCLSSTVMTGASKVKDRVIFPIMKTKHKKSNLCKNPGIPNLDPVISQKSDSKPGELDSRASDNKRMKMKKKGKMAGLL